MFECSEASEAIQYFLQNDINIKIAASEGDTVTVQRLLKDEADVNYKDIDGRSPLHFAINNGHMDIVNILLKNGAYVTQTTNKGNTPLHTATSRGYKEIVEVLLQHVSHDKLNDFINARTTSNGTTSLHVAAANGCLEIVKSLLKHGAIYNIENEEGKKPIDLSKDPNVTKFLKLVEELFKDTKYNNFEIMNKFRLLKRDEILAVTSAHNCQGYTILEVSQHVTDKFLKLLKEPDQVKLKLSWEYELDELKEIKSATELHLKFSRRYLPVLWSRSHPSEGEKNRNPWKTVKEGSYYLENVYHLVQLYKNVGPCSLDSHRMQLINNTLIALEFNPKHLSSRFTDEAYDGKAECFVSKGQGSKYYKLLHSEFNKDVRLFIEMVQLNIEIPVKQFLDSIKKRLQSFFSENLLEAIQNDNPLVVDKCIKHLRNSINCKDSNGITPLHHAVNNGNIDIVNMLLKNGAKVAQVSNKGNSPLHIASSKGYWQVTEVLLQHVSRSELSDFINARTTCSGTTSLHIAAANGCLEIVKSLLKHGAIYNIENEEGKKPIDLSKDPNVTKLLKLVEESFEDIKKGSDEIINKLSRVEDDEFFAITNACNNEGNSFVQVAMVTCC